MDTLLVQTDLPTQSFTTKFGLQFTAACIGGRDDWSLKNLYEGASDRALALDLGDALGLLGATQAYAPTPGFNAVFIDREELMDFVNLETEISMSSMKIWRNKEIPADCAPLYHRGAAGVFSAGGCPFIVGAMGRFMIFGHAGRGSMLDPALVLGRGEPRQHASVANTMLRELERLDPRWFNPNELEVWIFGSIRPENFIHKFHEGTQAQRKYSEALGRFVQRYGDKAAYTDKDGVYLDLPKILRQQLLDLKVSADNIHIDDDYSYVPDDLPTTRNGGGTNRYLSAVVRTR